MPKTGTNLLTELSIKNAKPKDKTYMLRDGGGLWLMVEPTGRKWWKLRVVFAKKENSFSLGEYPALSLAESREKRDAIRKQAAAGIDPGAARKVEKATQSGEGSFEAVARVQVGVVGNLGDEPALAFGGVAQVVNKPRQQQQRRQQNKSADSALNPAEPRAKFRCQVLEWHGLVSGGVCRGQVAQ